jgi:serine protease Do
VTVAEITGELLASSQGTGIGITVADITPRWRTKFRIIDTVGVVVTDISPDSPVLDAGMRPGDIIVEVDRNPVRNKRDYDSVNERTKKGSPVLFLIKRGKQTYYISIKTS